MLRSSCSFFVVGGAVLACLAACAGGGSADPPHAPFAANFATAKPPTRGASIQHIVVIVQENRSFDNLFNGYPGANTAQSGKDKQGRTIALQPRSLADPYGAGHSLSDFTAAYDNGKMDGFMLEQGGGTETYSYVPQNETALYRQMATQYVLADNMFASNIDGSFVAHQYLVAAQAARAVDYPSGKWGCGDQFSRVSRLDKRRQLLGKESPCFTYRTLADMLDAKGLTWHEYAPTYVSPGGIWSPYEAISQIYKGPDWAKDVINPPSQFLTDVASGTLSNVTWIIPDWMNADHAGNRSTSGPAWVASLVDAVGKSPFWNSTTILVLWDEWGGWYDHVPPPQLDYDGLGIRIPLLCISPYALQGHVTHLQLETASVVRYIEDNFSLGRLGAPAVADARAATVSAGCLDLKQAPRPFVPFQTSNRARGFLAQPPSNRAPDDD